MSMAVSPFPTTKPTRERAFKKRALNQAGESLTRERDRLFEDFIILGVGALFSITVAGMEIWRWWTIAPPQPTAAVVVAAIVTTFALVRGRKQVRLMRDLSLGIEGERVVGHEFEELRAEGWQVFHDIESDGFNLDHVLIGKRGIFVIDTKARRKPKQGNAVVEFDGQRLLVGGFEPDRDYVKQAAAARRWLVDLLKRDAGRTFPVRSVILFPEWFVKGMPAKGADLWVLNPEGLPKFLPREVECMERSDVELVATLLAKHIRDRRELREAKE